jgi:hypothetical protein
MIRLGIGEPDFLGGYPNTLAITPSQLKKHRAAIEELGFKIPSGAEPAPAPAPAGPKATFKKGDRVQQGGVIYEFDGKDWNAVR